MAYERNSSYLLPLFTSYDARGEPREYFFALKEIAEAKPAGLPSRWTVHYDTGDGNLIPVEIQVK